METYTFEEVITNALLGVKLELWVPVRRTSVDWTQFSVAILILIAESSTYFCWTAELFRRADKKHRENDLMNAQQTYGNLYPYGRTLVWFLRHQLDPNNPHGGFQRIEDLHLAGNTGLIQNFGFNSPCVLAILSAACARTGLE